MYTVKTASKEYHFSTFQGAKDFFYNSANNHKISLLTNDEGLVMIAQTGYNEFQTLRGFI